MENLFKNRILWVIIISIVLLYIFSLKSETGENNIPKVQGSLPTVSSSPTILPANQNAKKSLGLGITRQFLKNKLENPSMGFEFVDMSKYFKDDNTIHYSKDTLSVNIIGPKENITQISFIGDLYNDGDKNNDTLYEMHQLTNLVDMDITEWFIRRSLDFDNSFLPNTHEEKVINGRNVEISYTYNKDEVFGNPGYVFITITPAK